MGKKDLIVTLADKNFIDQAKQVFSSIYWNAGWKGDYMLLAHEIPEKELKWFRDKGILVKKCKPLYDKHIGRDNYPPTVLDKFYLFTEEFQKWGHVIFLDGDVIVRQPLDELTKIKGFGAVETLINLSKQFFKTEKNKFLFNSLKKRYNMHKPSFNTGVFVFNTSLITKNSFSEMVSLFYKIKEISMSADETTFNLFFYNNWKKLSVVYNLLVCYWIHFFHVNGSKINGKILHFMKNNKELISDKSFYFHKEWKENLDKAEFIDLKNIPKITPLNKFSIYRIHLKYIKHFCIFFLFLQKIKKLTDFIERIIGKIGPPLKKYDSNLFYQLKKMELSTKKIIRRVRNA
ncbi:Glycosyl transferase family 8 [uncultured archaeon]|nr:Glycosyl transferase family 8 [uncultured archaeon]